MLISTKGRYALRVMIDIARDKTGDYVSLTSIAENENISRQGVHDAIKHAEQYLDEFEEKMGLFRKTKVMHDMINAIRSCTAEYREKYSYQKNISEYTGKIIKIIDEGDELFG